MPLLGVWQVVHGEPRNGDVVFGEMPQKAITSPYAQRIFRATKLSRFAHEIVLTKLRTLSQIKANKRYL